MIKRASSPEELKSLPKTGVEAQKIRSLLLSYGTEYDFCRFFTSKNAVLAMFNGDFIISDFGEVDFEELAEFLNFSGFSEIFCSEKLGCSLEKCLSVERKSVNLMRFSGTARKADIEILSPSDAFKIIKSGFDIEFEPWYLDMSHRIRHGVSRLYGLCGSALAVQYNLNGEALISQVATLPEKRGHGNASRLISAVCGELSESKVFVLCENELVDFYKKNEFVHEGTKCCLKNNNP